MTLPPPSHTARAHSFNAAAAAYAAHRPSYPHALFDAIEELAGRPLTDALVADVGAGTGISTALLHARGARVLAVEPGEGMAAQLHAGLPDVPLVRGNGNALPFADNTLDLITYAQAWHWTDPALAVPEAVRVLRPGGALALWWNTDDLDVPWIAASAARIGAHFGVDPARERSERGDLVLEADPTQTLKFGRRKVRWSRSVPVDKHLANLASHSVFLVQEKAVTEAFLAEERERLLAVFPDGRVEETYIVDLLVGINA